MAAWPAPERGTTSRVPDGERSSLESWLEFHRATLLVKCAGLTPEQLVTRSCPPSPLSLLGLVRHMAEVETWFHVFDGQPEGVFYCSADRPDADFADLDPRLADRDLATYQHMIEEYARHNGHADLLRERIDGTTGS
jgi:hypothetical protein